MSLLVQKINYSIYNLEQHRLSAAVSANQANSCSLFCEQGNILKNCLPPKLFDTFFISIYELIFCPPTRSSIRCPSRCQPAAAAGRKTSCILNCGGAVTRFMSERMKQRKLILWRCGAASASTYRCADNGRRNRIVRSALSAEV